VIEASLASATFHNPGHRACQCFVLSDPDQDSDSAIAGIFAAAEISFDFTLFDQWKLDESLVAFCRGGISCYEGVDTLIFRTFPPFLYSPFMKYPGWRRFMVMNKVDLHQVLPVFPGAPEVDGDNYRSLPSDPFRGDDLCD